MGQQESNLPRQTTLNKDTEVRILSNSSSRSIIAEDFADGMVPLLKDLGAQFEGEENQVSAQLRVSNIFSNFTISDGFDVYLCFATSSNIVCSLPPVSTYFNSQTNITREFTFKLMSGGSFDLIINAAPNEFIDGEISQTITGQYSHIKLVPNGAYYWSITSR